MATCYRHPDRETNVSCSNCGKSICTDCMTTTSVGMRCPACSGQRTKVVNARALGRPMLKATYALIGLNTLALMAEVAAGAAFTGSLGGSVFINGALFGPLVAVKHEYWRLLTGAFLHAGILHLLFNMYILYWLGQILEPALGAVKFTALYFASLFAGSFGALVANPFEATVGASGAVFGLMGAAFIMQHRRGINPFQSGIGLTIGLNLALSFLIPHISVGGHIGGLIGGGVAGWLIDHFGVRKRSTTLAVLTCSAIAAASIVGAVLVADARTAAVTGAIGSHDRVSHLDTSAKIVALNLGE